APCPPRRRTLGGPYACPQVYLGQTNGFYNYQCLLSPGCTTVVNKSTSDPWPWCPTTCSASGTSCMDLNYYCPPEDECCRIQAWANGSSALDYDMNYTPAIEPN